MIEQLKNTDEAVSSALPNGHTVLRYPLRCQGTYRGFIGTYNYRKPFDHDTYTMLSMLGHAISALITTDPDFVITDENGPDAVFYQLLRCANEEQATAVCKRNAFFNSISNKCLVCLESSVFPAQHLRREFHQCFPNTICVLLENRAILLQEGGKPADEQLQTFCM